TFIHFYRPPVFWVCPNTFVPGGLFMVKPHLKHYRNAGRSEGSNRVIAINNKPGTISHFREGYYGLFDGTAVLRDT
ncbi:MAG: hypothetical protein WBK64_10340, partial [Dethiobacteria bacterium]